MSGYTSTSASAAAPLPPSLSAAVSSIKWSLDVGGAPPLHLKTLQEMKAIREQEAQARATRLPFDFLEDIPGTVENIFSRENNSEEINKDRRDFGLIATALILLGNGFTDECHNLITPLSWPEDIHFAHGPSVFAHTSPTARSYATYVHSLV